MLYSAEEKTFSDGYGKWFWHGTDALRTVFGEQDFRIGVIAHNLNVLFVNNLLDKSWRKHQVQTVRWRFYQAAGHLIFSIYFKGDVAQN